MRGTLKDAAPPRASLFTNLGTIGVGRGERGLIGVLRSRRISRACCGGNEPGQPALPGGAARPRSAKRRTQKGGIIGAYRYRAAAPSPTTTNGA
jgi:hypothetical protein